MASHSDKDVVLDAAGSIPKEGDSSVIYADEDSKVEILPWFKRVTAMLGQWGVETNGYVHPAATQMH